ncbi:MAG: hypothetical protein AABZ74_07880 [Cyanobacteriota bacterium]|mgnify:CR=1 FL=1
MINIRKFFVLILTFSIVVSCSLFGPDITGVWDLTSATNAKMQLQQNGNAIRGYYYFNGQNDGSIVGQIDGKNIVIQIRRASNQNTSLTGFVSDDGVSMQLTSTDKTGKQITVTLFKSR